MNIAINPKNQWQGIHQSEFNPPFWAKNRHIQTIWPRYFQKRKPLKTHKERFELDDGDFVDLSWSEKPSSCKGLVVMFHGLEGSIQSHYANDLIATLLEHGWQTVFMHFRGCSGEQNRLTRAYHSGDTQDALKIINAVDARFPNLSKVGIGFSLGGNMLLKLLGEQGDGNALRGAVAVSPPFRLAECAKAINQGFSKRYQYYLLTSMRDNLANKMQNLDYSNVLDLKQFNLDEIKSFRDFDHQITAPLHGYQSADDYYEKCSAIGFMSAIKTKTLVLHAKDDPFMNHDVLPNDNHCSNTVRVELSENGGHVGFMQGKPWAPRIWFQQRILRFLEEI
ncbi:hydrolase [Alteromonadaceae bacterium M269]|nr:hydrolase [Alteromonadaceae bacterium M269]